MKSIGNFKLLNKFILTFVLILSLTIISLSSILYSIFFKQVSKDLQTQNQTQLALINSELDAILDQSYLTYFNLSNSNNFINYVFKDEYDHYEEYKLYLELKEIYTISPYIECIEIYNAENQRYISTLATTSENKILFENDTVDFLNSKDKSVQFIKRSYLDDFGQPQDVISLVYSKFSDPNLYTIINVSCSYINSILSMSDDNSSLIAIIDKNSNIVSSNNYSLDISELDFSFATEKYDHCQKKLWGEKYNITYYKLDNIAWYSVNLSPTNLNYTWSFMFLKDSIFIAVIFMIVGCISSTFITRIIYTPFKKTLAKLNLISSEANSTEIDEAEFILNKFTNLQSKVDYANKILYTTQDATNEYVLTNLIKGTKNTTVENILENSQEFEYMCDKSYRHTCILVGLHDFETQYNSDDIDYMIFSILNYFYEILGDKNYIKHISLTKNKLLILYSNNKPLETSINNDFLVNFIETIKKTMNVNVSIFVSNPFENIHKLNLACAQTNIFSSLEYIHGYGIIVNEDIYESFKNLKTSFTYNYNEKILNNIFKPNYCTTAFKDLDEFVEQLSSVQPTLAKTTVNNFTEGFLQILSKKSSTLGIDKNEIVSVCQSLENAGNIFIFKEELHVFFAKIDLALQLGKSQTSSQHNKMVEEIMNYIEQNYSNPDLSVSQLASLVNVSPGYLGKIFTNHTGESLVSYISLIRIKYAKEKLLKNNSPAFKIGEEVGITNATYFTTIFKNATGLTPTAYRQEHKNSKNN